MEFGKPARVRRERSEKGNRGLRLGRTKEEGGREALAHALRFLHKEYEPWCWWWELLEMVRRLCLVGVFVLVQRGSLTQLAVGTIFCAVYLFIQMQVGAGSEAGAWTQPAGVPGAARALTPNPRTCSLSLSPSCDDGLRCGHTSSGPMTCSPTPPPL